MLFEQGLDNTFPWECVYLPEKFGLFLSACVHDFFKMVGTKQNMKSVEKFCKMKSTLKHQRHF